MLDALHVDKTTYLNNKSFPGHNFYTLSEVIRLIFITINGFFFRVPQIFLLLKFESLFRELSCHIIFFNVWDLDYFYLKCSKCTKLTEAVRYLARLNTWVALKTHTWVSIIHDTYQTYHTYHIWVLLIFCISFTMQNRLYYAT